MNLPEAFREDATDPWVFLIGDKPEYPDWARPRAKVDSSVAGQIQCLVEQVSRGAPLECEPDTCLGRGMRYTGVTSPQLGCTALSGKVFVFRQAQYFDPADRHGQWFDDPDHRIEAFLLTALSREAVQTQLARQWVAERLKESSLWAGRTSKRKPGPWRWLRGSGPTQGSAN